MKISPITSSTNSLLKKIRALHQRRDREKQSLFLIEGAKAVTEAFQKGIDVTDVVISQSYLAEQPAVIAAAGELKSVSVVDDKLFKELSTTTTPAGIMAVARMPAHKLAEMLVGEQTLLVIAQAVQDPGNLGTMVRTALAASASGMILTKGTVDPFSPKVVRSAMGALFALPVVWDVDYQEVVQMLRHHGVRVFACDANAPNIVWEANLRGPVAFVFGNEGQGLAKGGLGVADETISIPMNKDSESLNVAVSAAIILFSAVQQRLRAPEH